MPRSQALALIVVALALGFVVGFKSGRGAPPKLSPASAPAAVVPRLVDLGSTTCASCKEMAPILEELKAELRGQAVVEFIDVNERPAAVEEYQISLIPTQIFFDAQGQEVFRHEGFYPKADILAQFEKMGVKTR